VLPFESSVTPSSLSAFTSLVCVIVPNITLEEYISTWTTPSGESFTNQSSLTGRKHAVLNARIFSSFPQTSILTIHMLSYTDAGRYTCSIEFIGGANAGTTQNVAFELLLPGT